MKVSVVWFQNDCRIDDHLALKKASAQPYPIIGFYADHFSHPSFHPNRSALKAQSVLHTLKDLADSLAVYNIPLMYFTDSAHQAVQRLLNEFTVDAVYGHYHASPFERYEAVKIKALVPLHLYEGLTLIHPSDLTFDVAMTPGGFTSFRKKVEKLWLVRPCVDAELRIQDPVAHAHTLIEPTPNTFYIPPGEKAGLARLDHYTFKTKKISTYKTTRNGMKHLDDSTKFSLYLSTGAISPRRIYHTIKDYEAIHGASEQSYWVIFELLWRDFFKWQERKHIQHFYTASGIQRKSIAWLEDDARLAAIQTGKTGYPLIDANIKELLSTGYMSNRGRQNVASFWTKNLGLDWRLGERFFERHLLDYDPASNTGNWQYVSGIGNDSMPFRYFDVIGQGERYDRAEAYLLTWLPELKSVPAGTRYQWPRLSPRERLEYALDYPAPVVDFAASLNTMKQRFGVR